MVVCFGSGADFVRDYHVIPKLFDIGSCPA